MTGLDDTCRFVTTFLQSIGRKIKLKLRLKDFAFWLWNQRVTVMSGVTSSLPYVRAVSLHWRDCGVERQDSERDGDVCRKTAILLFLWHKYVPCSKKSLISKCRSTQYRSFQTLWSCFAMCCLLLFFFLVCEHVAAIFFMLCRALRYALTTVYTLHFVHVGVLLLIVYKRVSRVAR